MAWLIGAIVAIAIIYLMIVSPGFRGVAILIVVAAGIGIWVLIENDKKQSERRNQEEAARERLALTSIDARDLSFSDVKLVKSTWWTFKGMSVPTGFDCRDASDEPTVAVTSISFTEQPRQLLFFEPTCTFLDKLSDQQRCA